VEFQRAIAAVETIAAKTEDRLMYDEREKARRDLQWQLDGAREEGLQLGLQLGREEGRLEGLQEARQEILELSITAGKIQLLQKLLGEAPIATSSLVERPTDELAMLLDDLLQRWQARENR
jgi:flagellar biosynthesis/type III secretory pathway protein FliH